MTSTSFMTGTGFMKCIPMTFSGRPVQAAISVMEIDDVLEARIVSGPATRSSVSKIVRFRSTRSGTASMTRSMPSAPASSSPIGSIRASAVSRVA